MHIVLGLPIAKLTQPTLLSNLVLFLGSLGLDPGLGIKPAKLTCLGGVDWLGYLGKLM